MNDAYKRKRDLNAIGLCIVIGLAVIVVLLLAYGLTRPGRSEDQIAASAALARQMDASQAQASSDAKAQARANQDAMR